jgi:hypothetical protein
MFEQSYSCREEEFLPLMTVKVDGRVEWQG